MVELYVIFYFSDFYFGFEDCVVLVWVEGCIVCECFEVIVIIGDLMMCVCYCEFDVVIVWICVFDLLVMVEVGNYDMFYFNLWECFIDFYWWFCGMELLVECKIVLFGFVLVLFKMMMWV